MFIVAEHTIHDPDTFWQQASTLMPNLPPGLALHQSNPSPDGSRAICVWEADSVAAVQSYLDSNLGHVARNECYEVVNKDAIAVPPAYQTA